MNPHQFLILPITAILAGCATAGSTVSMVDSQSTHLQGQLDSENAKTRSLYEQQREIRARIAQLQQQKNTLIRTSGGAAEIAAIQGAIEKLQKKDDGLSAVIAASGL